jgi:hypothetical protein
LALTSLDHINAQLWTLKDELRKTESARADALKAANDPAAELPREGYLDDAANLKMDADILRSKIADLEAQRQRLADQS